jgi:hypothetical protein
VRLMRVCDKDASDGNQTLFLCRLPTLASKPHLPLLGPWALAVSLMDTQSFLKGETP